MYELFEHTADLGLRVEADSLEGLFVDAARGLLAMIVANPEEVRAVHTKTITLTADDPSYLLFDWLNELLYAFETEKLLLSQWFVHVQRSGAPLTAFPTELLLTATCSGEPMDGARHLMEHEVKAITYHALKVEQAGEGWRAEVIVDI